MAEIQLQHLDMTETRKAAHKNYKIIRQVVADYVPLNKIEPVMLSLVNNCQSLQSMDVATSYLPTVIDNYTMPIKELNAVIG